ncbi:hypothetical protein ARMGADRAFT_1168281 [Armillaria gallica]|uniref:Uncharacterized protein n=1 Tax=Armillaria gallica TaxID=47427 RepID=A0A2H3DIP9_ARMGA|nr:hypothetical protein ARMGADRAFT_1168281 [Armillaria gallica]
MWGYGLFGVLTVQMYIYHVYLNSKDSWKMRLYVWFIFLLEFIFTIFSTIAAWNQYGPGWGDVDSILFLDWSWTALPQLNNKSVFARFICSGAKLMHKITCKRDFDNKQADALYERELFHTAETDIPVPFEEQDLTSANYAESESSPDPLAPILGAAVVDETNISGSPEVPDQLADDISASVYETDDIRTVYHPAS